MSAGCKLTSRRLAAVTLAGILPVLLPQAAQAHGMFNLPPGFVAGLVHPLVVPGQVLPLVAAGLLSGQHGLAPLKASVPTLLLAMLAGMALAYVGLSAPWLDLASLGLAALLGLVVLIETRVGAALPVAAALLTGLMVGLGLEIVEGMAGETLRMAAGTLVAGGLLFAYLTALVAVIYRDWPDWMKIGVRTLGSWIAAIAILVGGLYFIK